MLMILKYFFAISSRKSNVIEEKKKETQWHIFPKIKYFQDSNYFLVEDSTKT